MVLNGEVEVLTSIPGMEEDEDGEALDNDDDVAGISRPIPEEAEDLNSMAVPTIKSVANPFSSNAHGASLAHILPAPSPMSCSAAAARLEVYPCEHITITCRP